MADSPDQEASYSPSEGRPPSTLGVPQQTPSRSTSPTQYEFIMTTGDESATTRKKNLKTVRSQVMKNFLAQQQQRQGRAPGESSKASDRRRDKQRARSSRSASREYQHGQSPASPAISEGAFSIATQAGPLLSDFSYSDPFASIGERPLHGHQQFALDFSFTLPQDEVALMAQTYLTSLLEDKRNGMLQPSFQTLNSKGETVRLVKDILGICGNDVPESVVFSVKLLSFGCRIVEARGGIRTLDFELQRAITWTTYSLAGVLQRAPHFPPPLFPETGSFPLAFLDDAQIRAWRTVKRFPKNHSFVFDMVLRMQQLSLAMSSEWYDDVDQRAVSNLYFEALNNVLTVPLEEPWNANLASGSQGQEMATMFRVWAAGSPLFIWATARHVRSRSGATVTACSYDPIYARIRAILDSAGGYHAWPRGKGLEPVLVTLFYCVESCDPNNLWRPWLMENLRKVSEMSKLKTVEDFKKILEYFPCTDQHKAAAGELWNEMFHGGSGAVLNVRDWERWDYIYVLVMFDTSS
ncbi:hypothetical protein EJ04DRAFT_552793 [Polyplosphaeria fusca]|uniref:Uncharacterized protein n=1 Tax=Polyplosphaeria fusca TaxID=682080 RepID=A0A9P4R037_9PLEO|nr:hypothetical protein EJ04DRAFT_552793 [Polyplosphaeria fusca]